MKKLGSKSNNLLWKAYSLVTVSILDDYYKCCYYILRTHALTTNCLIDL